MRLFVLAAVLACTAPALAQTTAPDSIPPNTTLSAVTVSATRLRTDPLRTPMAVSTLGPNWTQLAQPQLTLQESLVAAPGVLATNADNFAQDLRLAVRGFGARSAFGIRGVRVLLDGLPESTPDGQGQVDNIDPGAIERTELLRGAAAGLYGNASGGVLNLFTAAPPAQRGFAGSVRSTLGSWGYRQQRLSLAERRKRWAWATQTSYTALDGYRDHSAVRSTLFNAKAVFNNRISLIFNYADSPQADDAGALTLAEATQNPRAARALNEQFAAGESLRQGKLGATGRHDLHHGTGTLEWHAFGVKRQFENSLPTQSSGIVTFDRTFWGAGAAYTQHLDFLGLKSRLRGNVEWESQRDDRQRFNNDNGTRGTERLHQLEQFDDLGAGLQLETPLDPAGRWLAMGALRYDWLRSANTDRFLSDGDDSDARQFHNLNPLAGLTFSASPALNVYANLATAFETPTLTELANPNGSGGFNPNLDPQRSHSGELGLKGRLNRSKIRYDAALYLIRSRNEIVPFEIDSLPNRTFYRNAGATRRLGAELSVEAPLYRSLSLLVVGNYGHFRYQTAPKPEFDGHALPGLPASYGLVALQFLPEMGFFATVQARYAASTYTDDSNATEVPAVWLLGARGGWHKAWRQMTFEIFAGGNNLTDARYYGNLRINAAASRYYEPGAGRSWYVGARLGFSRG